MQSESFDVSSIQTREFHPKTIFSYSKVFCIITRGVQICSSSLVGNRFSLLWLPLLLQKDNLLSSHSIANVNSSANFWSFSFMSRMLVIVMLTVRLVSPRGGKCIHCLSVFPQRISQLLHHCHLYIDSRHHTIPLCWSIFSSLHTFSFHTIKILHHMYNCHSSIHQNKGKIPIPCNILLPQSCL